MDTMYTTDKKEVLYADLYLDTKALSAVLTSVREEGSLLCHILSLYNLIQSHFKPINYYRKLLKSFICKKLTPIKNTTIMLDHETSYERYG